MKKIVTLLFIFPLILFGQDFKKEFTSKFSENEYNSTEIENILENWKKSSKNDVEYYISAFNFYFKESQEVVLQLTPDEPQVDKEALIISDSLGNEMGYINSQVSTNDSLFNISQSKIEEAIKLSKLKSHIPIHQQGEEYQKWILKIEEMESVFKAKYQL
mgnify:CR=1 FL=1